MRRTGTSAQVRSATWFRRILPWELNGNGCKRARVSDAQGRNGLVRCQNNGAIPAPSNITVVRDIRDILPFHDGFLQQLGDQFRFTLFRINLAQSPDPQCDFACDNTWATHNGPNEILRLEKAVYLLLKKAFQDYRYYVTVRHIFLCHQGGQPLCASRVWFSLVDTFQSQLHGRESHRKQSTMGHSVGLQQHHAGLTSTRADRLSICMELERLPESTDSENLSQRYVEVLENQRGERAGWRGFFQKS
jgi:hypothetical protein